MPRCSHRLSARVGTVASAPSLRAPWATGLLLVVLVVLALAACSPTPTEEAEERAGDDPDQGEPSDIVDVEENDVDEPEEFEETLDRIATQVSELRSLPWREEVVTEVVDGDELAEVAVDRDLDAGDRAELDGWSRVLVALRHLPEGADLEEIYADLATAGIAGLYDPEDQVAYVASEELPLGPSGQMTTAHELVHALQDQHFDLSRLHEIEVDDEALAFLSVVEGDAVLTEEDWATQNLSEEDRIDAEQEDLAAADDNLETLQDLPEYVVESFLFPYSVGERFVTALREEGGFAAVDAAIEEPPVTTLEVLDPDRYLEGFEAVDVELGGPEGDDWQPLVAGSFGAFELLALFGAVEASEAVAAWPSWVGGGISSWEQDGDIAVVAAWAFDEREAADAVCAALPAWYESVAGEVSDESTEHEAALSGEDDVLAVRCDDDAVGFALTGEVELAEDLLDGLDVGELEADDEEDEEDEEDADGTPEEDEDAEAA